MTPQLCRAHVHQHLVEGPVEEGGVDGDDRVQAAHGQAGGAGGGVLLGDADVERALGEPRLEVVEPDRVHHRGGDRDDVLAALADVDDLVGEDVGPDPALGVLLAGLDVEGPAASGTGRPRAARRRRTRSPCG